MYVISIGNFEIDEPFCVLRSVLDDCCVEVLIIMEYEGNHSMGSSIDGTPPQSED